MCKHFQVAVLLGIHQRRHRHAAQRLARLREALRLECAEKRGEAEIRQELALRHVAERRQPVPLAEPHEGREVDVAGDVLFADVFIGILASGMAMVANERARAVRR